jgi:hypothetical protein
VHESKYIGADGDKSSDEIRGFGDNSYDFIGGVVTNLCI